MEITNTFAVFKYCFMTIDYCRAPGLEVHYARANISKLGLINTQHPCMAWIKTYTRQDEIEQDLCMFGPIGVGSAPASISSRPDYT